MRNNRQGLIRYAVLSCFLIIFLCAPAILTALDPEKKITQYGIQVWNREAGLPDNSIYAVIRTHDNYLWLGTKNGLVRFDGMDFEPYNSANTPEITNNEIRALYEDRNNVLWIGTAGRLVSYKAGEFSTISAEEQESLNKIRALGEDRDGNLWIGSLTHGLTRRDSQGLFITYTHEDGLLPSNEIRGIYKDADNDLWVATAAGIVQVLGPGKFEVYASQDPGDFIRTTCLYRTDTRELWVGTGGGLLRFKDGTPIKKYGIADGLPHATVTCLFLDGLRNLWIGTDGGGLTRMRDDGECTTLSTHNGLAGRQVYSILEDKENSLWVGTLLGGLHQLTDRSFTSITTLEGLAHDTANCIFEDGSGNIWLGTNGGLDRLEAGTPVRELTVGRGGLNGAVVCLSEDTSGYLLIGTPGGLYRFKPGEPSTLSRINGLSDNHITGITRDSRDALWVGTVNGLNRIDTPGGGVTAYTTADGLSGNSIAFVFQAGRGHLLVGTGAGVHRITDGTIDPSNLLPEEKGHHGLLCVHEDNNGVLWFGTENGLFRVYEKQTTHYTVQNGLNDNYIYAILEDQRGRLWLGGRNGITWVPKDALEDLSGNDRLPASAGCEVIIPWWCTAAGTRTRDGRFWFPTLQGVAAVAPGEPPKTKPAPTPILKRFVVDGEPVNIRAAAVELEPKKERLEFHYTGISFINPHAITFRIKLDGYDEDWVDMGNMRSTTYTGLPPKTYTFYVKAENSTDGKWDGETASFTFELLPHFTQTPAFFIALVIFVLTATFSIHRLRVRQLKAREKELAIQVEERTHDLRERNDQLETARQKLSRSNTLIQDKNIQLESQTLQLTEQSDKLKEMDRVKSRFFANISHEFRTPITLIMGPLEQMLTIAGDDGQKKKINLMLRNAQRLLALINQLLELSKLESGKVKLQARRRNIIPFLKGQVANFQPVADRGELALIFLAETEDITVDMDAEKMEQIMGNLLVNAVKFTPPGGKITVSVIREPGEAVQVSVSDTGPGIARDQLPHIFERFYQSTDQRRKGSGIGLALVKELVQLHRGKIDVYSRENKGTTFIITLPDAPAPAKPGPNASAPIKPGVPADAEPDAPAPILEVPEIHEDRQADAREEPAAPAGGKSIILVVEDNADMREYIRGALAPVYTVIEAGDGESGLSRARESIPDLIISDVMMPGMDGCELCARLKKDIKTSHIPVVLLTARASEESAIRGLEAGADDYITKPFSVKLLSARIENLIELRRQLQQSINREMTDQPVGITVSALDREFLDELKTAISKHLSDPDFNVEQLAKILYMDRSTIYRKTLALTGETPTEFIRSCRLARGAKLLKEGVATVLEVAFEVGFSSATYFTKCFKKKYHQLPSRHAAHGPSR